MNNGVLFDKRQSDYILGASPVFKVVLLENGNWKPWTPEHEIQFNYSKLYDTLMCVSFSATDCLEYQFTFALHNNLLLPEDVKWLSKPIVNGKQYPSYFKNGFINFSERFVGTLGETSSQGAYQYKVGDAIRKFGLIPQDMFPLADNFNDNIDKKFITQEMYDLGAEFIKRFPISYEWISSTDDIKDALKYGPVQVCVRYADYKDSNITAILCPIEPPQHATTEVNKTDEYDEIDDSYSRQFKRYCKQGIYSPMLYTINFKKKDMVIKKEKGKPDIWLIIESNKTKINLADMPSFIPFNQEFEEVDNLDAYTENGSFLWLPRKIN